MSVWSIICVLDIVLWAAMAVSVLYVFFFAVASLLPPRASRGTTARAVASSFVVIFPAYREDSVIRASVEAFLRQDYPESRYQLVVVSDGMTAETNAWLASQTLTLLTPTFDKSSKAKALQYAVRSLSEGDCRLPDVSHVVILDADNIVAPDFLSRLDAECRKGYAAIQCHRTAKNSDSDIAALDGLSEEINNSIFRRGHNRVGLSSALIGSGMCFDYSWFAANVGWLDSAVEDRELEALLMRQRVHVHYAEDIIVMDEKVSSGANFQRQRLRWMTGQVQTLVRMAPYLPEAVARGNADYVDKTLQQALLPRSVLLLVVPLVTLLATLAAACSPAPLLRFQLLKWWLLTALLAAGIFAAIPPRLRTRSLLARAAAFPAMAMRMVGNMARIRRRNTDFLHTEHGGHTD